MSARRVRAALAPAALLALATCGTGCAKQHVVAVVPPPEPPLVEAVYPAARSTFVPYDSEIWIRFREPLDLATVNTDNLFLKLDTVRLPIALSWDAATRTLGIAPQVKLKLRRTYTVEVTSRLRTASGRAVGDPFFWQFGTNSVRRLEGPIPPDGATWESPFAMLGWDSTETEAGEMEYQVFEGADSAAVASHAGAPSAFSGRGFWIPRARWAQGARAWWSVRAVNHSTGESTEGPAWHFDVIPAGAPTDSVLIPLVDFGWWNSSFGGRVACRSTLVSGTIYNDALSWSLARFGPDLRVADQDLVFASVNALPVNWSTLQVQLFAVRGYYNVCTLTQTNPSPEGDPLAPGVRVGVLDIVQFRSEAFAAHLEASARYGRVWGYTLRSNATFSYGLGLSSIPNSGSLKLVFYRPPAAAARGPLLAGARP